MSGESYIVDSFYVEDDQPAVCSDCGWAGLSQELNEIGNVCLDAGDPSPAGRCPDCDCIAYLDRAVDRQRSHAEEAFELLFEVKNVVADETRMAIKALLRAITE